MAGSLVACCVVRSLLVGLVVWGLWPLSTPVVAAQNERVYLPVISRALDVAPSWSYAITCGAPLSGPLPSPALLPPDVRLLESRFVVGGGAGLMWRAEWRLNGQPPPGLTATGVIPSSGVISMQVAANADMCHDPLPAGEYTVRLFVADLVRALSSATLP